MDPRTVTAEHDTRSDWAYWICFLYTPLAYFLIRQLRLLVNLWANYRHRAIPIPDNPAFTPQDVTVIVPTICDDVENLRETLRTVARNGPRKIYVVTVEEKFKTVSEVAAGLSSPIKVLRSRVRNKRIQMCRAIPKVNTRFILFADDDVGLPDRTLSWMLAPFEGDERMGGVGTGQRVRRGADWNAWRFLGYQYIARRNFDCSAGVCIDGGLPCLAGRAAMYRTQILKDSAFMYGFTHEEWEWPWPFSRFKTYLIHADDDNYLTRWMVSHGWDIHIQVHPDCMVDTSLEVGDRFIQQCLRWSRSNWRSNHTSLFREGHIWRRHPWSVFAFFLTTFVDVALPRDAWFCLAAWIGTGQWLPADKRTAARVALIAWITLFCKVVKFDWWRRPEDLRYVLLVPLFGWFHSIRIKLHALWSLSETTWGSREGADADDALRLIALPSYEASLADSSHGLDRITEAFIYDEGDSDDDDDDYDVYHGGNQRDEKHALFADHEYAWVDVPLPAYSEDKTATATTTTIT